MLSDLHSKLITTKLVPDATCNTAQVTEEEVEDEGDNFTLTQICGSDDKNATFTECTQVI